MDMRRTVVVPTYDQCGIPDAYTTPRERCHPPIPAWNSLDGTGDLPIRCETPKNAKTTCKRAFSATVGKSTVRGCAN